MVRRVSLVVGCLAVLVLSGGCRSQACTRPVCDPLRELGVDCRGLVGSDREQQADGRQVFLDMTVARIPEAHVQQALGADRPLFAGDPKTVSAARASALRAAWRRSPAVRVTSAPKILALPGQEASVFLGETVAFAKTVATEAEDLGEGATQNGETIRYRRTQAVTNQEGGLSFSIEEDPLGPVTPGMRIGVVSNPSEDGRELALEISGSWRELKQDLSADAVAAMSAAEFETYVREHRLDTSFTMPGGGWVVVGNPTPIETAEGPLVQVVLLHAVVLRAGRAVAGE